MNLVIGNSSQLSYYFPDDYIKISSRNIDFEYLKNNQWDSVYITFAEQRIYNSNIDYITPNYIYTLDIINSLLECSKKIVCYTSCELWSNLSGFIDAQTPPDFALNNEYTLSKLLLFNKIKNLRQSLAGVKYYKVIFVHPFYFNSVYRNEYFLFGKIFKSIITKQKIQLGSLHFYRDMVHPKFLVDKSIEAKTDCVIGSGKLFNVRDFVKDLYTINDMSFDYYVEENNERKNQGSQKLIMAKVPWDYTYEDLLRDTQEDLKQAMEKNG